MNKIKMKSSFFGMMTSVLLLLFIGSSLWGFDANEIETELVNRFKLESMEYKGRKYLSVSAVKNDAAETSLARLCNDFIDENRLLTGYFAQRLRDRHLDIQSKAGKERTHAEEIKAFDAFVQKNKQTLAPVASMFGLFLKSKGHPDNKENQINKPSYTWAQVKEIAVKNVHIKEIMSNGKARVKICVAGEGFLDSPRRNLLLEAFTFQAMMNGLGEKTFGNAVYECMEAIEKLKLSPRNEGDLQKARDVSRAILLKDKQLETLLRDIYSGKRVYLPFEIR